MISRRTLIDDIASDPAGFIAWAIGAAAIVFIISAGYGVLAGLGVLVAGLTLACVIWAIVDA
jgi:hypothetical protein